VSCASTQFLRTQSEDAGTSSWSPVAGPDDADSTIARRRRTQFAGAAEQYFGLPIGSKISPKLPKPVGDGAQFIVGEFD
jgi:hypothetical protein